MMAYHFSFLFFVILSFTVRSSTSSYSAPTTKFNCPPLPPLTQSAQSVHELKPQDIKVIMALGDSITAGFAAKGLQSNFLKDLLEYRGISWSIGGDPDAMTLANFLKHYTTNLTGASIGSHFGEFCGSSICYPNLYKPEQDVFNAAQTGAFTGSLNRVEFGYLLKQIKKNPNVNFEKDWKLMTILIGYNDLCAMCSHRNTTIVDEYESNLRELLERIRLEIPRTFVNLVELFNVTIVYEKNKGRDYCVDVHKLLPIDCQCLWTGGDEWRQKMDEYAQRFNAIIQKVSKEYRNKKYDDFAVVAQPGLRDTVPSDVALDMFSSLDCFHPSVLGHQAFATVVWNNMLTPAAHKITAFNSTTLTILCPNNSTLLYTY